MRVGEIVEFQPIDELVGNQGQRCEGRLRMGKKSLRNCVRVKFDGAVDVLSAVEIDWVMG